MAAIDKSIYEIFEIETPDGRTADISAGVIGFSYFENLFSPYLTAKVIVTNTGTSIENDKGVMTGIYNGLPLRGGEKLRIKIAGNSKINGGMDFSDDEDKLFYVASITNVILEAESESFTLNFLDSGYSFCVAS